MTTMRGEGADYGCVQGMAGKGGKHRDQPESYMGCTGGVAPWRRDGDTGPSYYAVCPLCDNPIQIVGLFRRQEESRARRPYGRHHRERRAGPVPLRRGRLPALPVCGSEPSDGHPSETSFEGSDRAGPVWSHARRVRPGDAGVGTVLRHPSGAGGRP